LLKAAEDRKGTPLSENEVLEIRNNATTTSVPFSAAFALEEERGYRDIARKSAGRNGSRYAHSSE
jgi:hypothetical protein